MNINLDLLDKNIVLPEKLKETILYSVAYILKNYHDAISAIILFGSCARCDVEYNSDVDLLVLSKNELDRNMKADIRAELCENPALSNVDIVFYTISMFKESDSLLVKNIRKDGYILWRK